MVKIVVSAFIGSENIGDEAIFESVINSIKNTIESPEIYAISINPEKTRRLYKVNTIYSMDVIETIKRIKGCDVLVLGGGGIIQEETSKFSVFHHLYKGLIGLKFKKSIFLYGIGVSPIKNRFNKTIVRKICNHAEKITVRDIESKEELIKVGVKEDKILVTADPAVNLKPISKKEITNILSKEKIILEKKLIGLTLRHPIKNRFIVPTKLSENINSSKEKIFLNKMSDLITYLNKEYDANFLFVPFWRTREIEICKTLKKNIDDNYLNLIIKEYKPTEILGMFQFFDIFLGMRLHSLIFSAIAKKPMLGVSYSKKIDNFLKRIYMQEFSIPYEFNYDSICSKIKNLISEKENIEKKIEKNFSHLKKLEKENIKILKEIIES